MTVESQLHQILLLVANDAVVHQRLWLWTSVGTATKKAPLNRHPQRTSTSHKSDITLKPELKRLWCTQAPCLTSISMEVRVNLGVICCELTTTCSLTDGRRSHRVSFDGSDLSFH